MENTPTYKVVHDALAPTEEILRAEFERQLTAQFQVFANQLAADGMDANKSYFYPNSTKLNRTAYAQQLTKYRYCQSHSKPNWGRVSRRLHDPDYRKLDFDTTIEAIKVKAVELAKQSLDGYCAKLSRKILDTSDNGSTLKAEYVGGSNPWGYSHLRVDTSNGQQLWRTKMIINVSCLGTVFNQWPTRLVKGT